MLNGFTKTYYHNGSLFEIKYWLNGELDGEWKQFFFDGSLKMETSFKSNKRDGKHISYHPNGKIYFSGSYTDDLKSGIWQYFSADGIADTLINYNE